MHVAVDTLDKLMVAVGNRLVIPKLLWRFVLSDYAQVHEIRTELMFVYFNEGTVSLLIR